MLTVRLLDCQSDTIHLDVVGYGESAIVRGEDVIIPARAGRTVMNRVVDVYRFSLQGHVRGIGSTREERSLSWRTATDALMAVMDFALDPDEVVIGPAAPAQFPGETAPYLGLTGERVIVARCVSMVRGPVQNHMSFQGWSFEMECVDGLGWQEAGSS